MRLIPPLLSLALCLLLLTCSTPDCGCIPPIDSIQAGRWAWVKTVTPSRTLTPQQAGYTRSMSYKYLGQ
jgi:hypothetical protein